MDTSYLLSAARYVERNPVEVGLVERAESWPWSSAAAHVSGRGDAVAEVEWLRELTAGWVCNWSEEEKGVRNHFGRQPRAPGRRQDGFWLRVRSL